MRIVGEDPHVVMLLRACFCGDDLIAQFFPVHVIGLSRHGWGRQDCDHHDRAKAVQNSVVQSADFHVLSNCKGSEMTFRDRWEPASQRGNDYATVMPESAADASGAGVKMGYGQADESGVTLSDLSRFLMRHQVSDLPDI